MKRLRKLLGVVAAVAMTVTMLLGSGIPVMADETVTQGVSTTGSSDAGPDPSTGSSTTNSLTIKNTGNTDHIFELYQIFTGDYTKDSNDKGTLSNIQWGNGVSKEGQTALGDAAKKAGNITDAAAFATEVKPYLTNPTTSSTSVAVNTSYKFDNLTAGYYLVKDVDGSQKDTKGAYTSYIVEVVGDVTANTKLGVPTVVKKVKDTNDSTGETTGWQDSADYDIGDEIPYQITGTMPSNIGDYKSYKYIFTDKMSKGLTYTAKNETIKIGDKDVTSSFTKTVTNNADGSTTVTWSCDNLKGINGVSLDKDTKVVVTYTCKLNNDAVIGSAGNPNEVDLTFSNNPNKGGEKETGKTPKDKNIVFTYKVVVNKVDQDSKALAGAEFTLSKVKADKTSEVVKTFTLTGDKDIDPTTFTASGLDDGTYVLKETKTPAGYNTIADQYFTITADHETNSDDPKLTSLSGDKLTGSAQTTITFTADKDAGSLTTTVENKKGTNLPSTGGIGTTIFYAAGACLAVAAGVILVARKRMSSER